MACISNNGIGSENMISILVLTYNNLKYYKQCLDSIFEQTYNDIELIISDDCSINFDYEDISKYIELNKKRNIKNVIINVNEANEGIVKNYNKAIRLSKGEYIFYLAVDDVLFDNKVIEDVVNYFETTNSLIFTGYKDVYNEDLNKCIKTQPRELEVDIIKQNNSNLLYESLCKGSFISGSNTPFSRELIKRYGYIDEKYFHLEDYPRYLQLTQKGCNISFYDRKLIKYRMGGVTTNGEISEVLRKDLKLATMSECREFFLKSWNLNYIKRKKIIGWGTGDCLLHSLKLINFKIDYLVDSNKKVQNTKVNGIQVLSPNVLRHENNKDVFIFVFSYANYFDIANALNSMGFEENEDYFICTPSILEIVSEK